MLQILVMRSCYICWLYIYESVLCMRMYSILYIYSYISVKSSSNDKTDCLNVFFCVGTLIDRPLQAASAVAHHLAAALSWRSRLRRAVCRAFWRMASCRSLVSAPTSPRQKSVDLVRIISLEALSRLRRSGTHSRSASNAFFRSIRRWRSRVLCRSRTSRVVPVVVGCRDVVDDVHLRSNCCCWWGWPPDRTRVWLICNKMVIFLSYFYFYHHRFCYYRHYLFSLLIFCYHHY